MIVRRVLVAAVSAAALLVPSVSAHAASARHFTNCTAMHRVYPHGVGRTGARDHVTSGQPVTTFTRSNALYAANSGSDRDGDHIACEAH